MITSKKGVEVYLILLLIISVVMGLLLFFITESIYVRDPDRCYELDYEITNICRVGEELRINVNNPSTSRVMMVVNGVYSPNFDIGPRSTKQIRVSVEENQVVSIGPQVSQGLETLQCNSKLKNIRVGDVRRC